jgi:hypothetical protein
MRVQVLILAAVLPLAAAAAPPRTPTLSDVHAMAPDASVQVNCRYAEWPTLRQVARYLGHDDPAATAPMRRDIVKQGRQACDAGATHVLVEFYRGRGDREVAVQYRP